MSTYYVSMILFYITDGHELVLEFAPPPPPSRCGPGWIGGGDAAQGHGGGGSTTCLGPHTDTCAGEGRGKILERALGRGVVKF